jgi:hypothetical protein
LAVGLIDQRWGHAVIDDRVETYLCQRVMQLGCGAIERAGLAGKIGAKIDHRNCIDLGHGVSCHSEAFNGFSGQNRGSQPVRQCEIAHSAPGIDALAQIGALFSDSPRN